jgi:hypothetical protein
MGNNNSIMNLIPSKINFYPMNPNLARIAHDRSIKNIKHKNKTQETQSQEKPSEEKPSKEKTKRKYLKYKQKYIMLKNKIQE